MQSKFLLERKLKLHWDLIRILQTGQTRSEVRPAGGSRDRQMADVFAQAEAFDFSKAPEKSRAQGTMKWLVPHCTFETIVCRTRFWPNA